MDEYLLAVIDKYFKRKPCVFQQDGASIHTANEVTQYFRDKNVHALDWPPHSPDLNIIENVWHYLKTGLSKRQRATSRSDLWETVVQTMPTLWSPEMTEKINDLYDSLPRRMQAVIAAHGGNTKY